MTTTPEFKAGTPEVLFPAPIFGGGGIFNVHRWDTLNGKRFLIDSIAAATSSSPMTLVLNWQEQRNNPGINRFTGVFAAG